jgi:hypothetical protein
MPNIDVKKLISSQCNRHTFCFIVWGGFYMSIINGLLNFLVPSFLVRIRTKKEYLKFFKKSRKNILTSKYIGFRILKLPNFDGSTFWYELAREIGIIYLDQFFWKCRYSPIGFGQSAACVRRAIFKPVRWWFPLPACGLQLPWAAPHGPAICPNFGRNLASKLMPCL